MNFCTVSHRDGHTIHDKTHYNPLAATLEFGALKHEKGIKPDLEDNAYADPLTKRLTRSNGELADKAVQIASLVGREPATPAEARAILSPRQRPTPRKVDP